LDWTSDSREIVFSAAVGAGARRRLWRTSASRASAELLTIGGEFALNPTISSQGNGVIYTELINSCGIWQIDLAGSKGISSHPLISSTQVENSPQFSPDGKKVVFASTRTGSYEIWTCDSDGGNPKD
jgi:Tol biopolymer transport system component